MATKLFITIFSTMTLFLLACARHSATDDKLTLAECMMHDHPDSTLAILEAFPQDSLFTDEQRALYALLLTQARDKNYIDETCDSIVKIAVSFYATFNNKARLMMSLYYLARIQYNMGDYSRSIVNYDKAEKIAASIDDKFYLETFSKCPYLNVI